ncbi:MAG: type II secretion system major pseudopilin GspG [Akkermansiaceae bacterium]|nr:type II secretion system major pseudopilin GspG [Verrucomicrobiales bacterium]
MKLISRHSFRRKASQGFTLIELLLVLAILGILAAIVVPKMAGRSEDARKQAAVTQISAFKTALNTYEVDNGGYPRGQGGLIDLIKQPRDSVNWKGPYLDSDVVPKDPWNHDYVYVCPGKNNSSSYDLSSPGPDGQPGNDDDITNWSKR